MPDEIIEGMRIAGIDELTPVDTMMHMQNSGATFVAVDYDEYNEQVELEGSI